MIVNDVTPRETVVVVLDDDKGRVCRLKKIFDEDHRFFRCFGFDKLNEAFMFVEANPPDLVVISHKLSNQPEFPMFRHLLRMISAACYVLPNGSAYPAANLRRRDDLKAFVEMIAGKLAHFSSDNSTNLDAMNQQKRDEKQGLILIGSSTGGTDALSSIFKEFPSNCPPTLVVQHMREGFITGLVSKLNAISSAEVRVAKDQDVATRGTVLVAGDIESHLVVNPHSFQCRLVNDDPMSGHRPSVDKLFRSAIRGARNTVSVLLTGMGKDGAEGMKALRDAGGRTIVQDEATCVVYGMPRAAVKLGAAEYQLPLDSIARAALDAASKCYRAR